MVSLRVSVIIPTLNEASYLGDCLRSIAAQNFDGIPEVIVVDGRSADTTVSIAKKYADKVIVEPKRTIAAGRQAGAAAASGDILVFTDADSRPPEDWLSTLTGAFADSNVVSSYGALAMYDYKKTGVVLSSLMSAYLYWADVFEIPAGAGSNMAVRADAFRKVGGFNTDLVTGEDIELQKRLKKVGKVVFCRKAKNFVSARRIKGWGVAKFVGFHTTNFLKLHMGKDGHDEYEPVR